MLSYKVTYAIQILCELDRAGESNKRLTISDLRTACGLENPGISVVMSALRERGWIQHTNYKHFVQRNLSEATLYDLVMDMDGSITMGESYEHERWPYSNRCHHRVSIEFDNMLGDELAEHLKKVPLSILFRCRDTPRASRSKGQIHAKDELRRMFESRDIVW